ncbi:hypothetical protein OC846_002414 [Tilletia horrida]|uniref:Zn(2)-C6 fungal-type domain-containing protein n=1 Tax=Tilletia horrida TaxID=155126 RepID=A0AAN6GUF4_9BASI|nr:hypothetical protein OC846_002414 [Tilletia horrida]
MLANRPPPKKRNRAALSCTSCRERKIKCSRQVPCDQCIKRGDEALCRMAPHPKAAAQAQAQTQPQSSNAFGYQLPSTSAASSSGSIIPFGGPAALSISSAAVPAASGPAAEVAAIKERLAQLEASLAQAQMQAAHHAAIAAAAAASTGPAGSLQPPPPAPGPTSAQASNQLLQISSQQQQQPWLQGPNSVAQATRGTGLPALEEGVDSDTEDAAAVLEGLAYGPQKHGIHEDKHGHDASQSPATASSTLSMTHSNTASSATTPASAAAPSPASATGALNPRTYAPLKRTGGSGRSFQLYLEADKQRDLMLPDGQETPAQETDRRLGTNRKLSASGGAVNEPMDVDNHNDEGESLDDSEEYDEDEEVNDPHDPTRSSRPSLSATSDASQTSEQRKEKEKQLKAAQRVFDRSNKALSDAYKGIAAQTRNQLDAAAGTAIGGNLPSSARSLPADSPAANSASGHVQRSASVNDNVVTLNAPEEKDEDAAATAPGASTPKGTPSAFGTLAPMSGTATHIRGPTADAYDLSRSHQGLFRVIVQGESMLGFGLGWPFAAAEENGDYKEIKGIGACPGNTQREAVLRAIIRTVPEKKVVDQLLNVWEENASFLAGKVIHVPTLRKEIETFFAFDSVEKRARVVAYVDPGWLSVLLMVFVTAMQFWPSTSSKSPNIFDGRSLSMWYAAAKTALVLARYQSSQSLSVLQAIILINLHAQESGRVNLSLIRIAINNAMDLRLHRLGDADKALGANGMAIGPCAFVRRQIELRIWWALVFRDWSSSACTGHYMINPDYFNTPLPANLNEYELCQTPTPQPHPLDTATEMSYVLANIEFAKAVRISTDMLNKASIRSLGKTKSLSTTETQTLDTVFRAVLANAPSFFQAGSREGEGTNLELQRWLFVQGVFHKLLHLHRSHISTRSESRMTCVLLARSILDMQSKLRVRCSVINRLCYNLMQSFSAASLLCLDLLQSPPRGSEGSDPALRNAIRSEVSEALEALKSVAEENRTALRMYRIIEALLTEEEQRWNSASAAEADLNSSSAHQASLKRKRSAASASADDRQQRKKELLSLARRVAEAAKDQLPAGGMEGGCPMVNKIRDDSGSSDATSISSGPGSSTGARSGANAVNTGAGLAGTAVAQQAVSNGNQVQSAASNQRNGPTSSGAPLIYPRPSLVEHRIFTDKEFATTTAPTQMPSFPDFQVAMAPNGLELNNSGASAEDLSGFDLNSFLVSIGAAQPSPASSGAGASVAYNSSENFGNMAAAEAATAAAAQWLNQDPGGINAQNLGLGANVTSNGLTSGGNVSDLFGLPNFNALGPSPSASASSSSVLSNAEAAQLRSFAAAQTQGPSAAAGQMKGQPGHQVQTSNQPLPTPPQSDSAGSSSGASPPANADNGTDNMFWNWLLGQGNIDLARNPPSNLGSIPALEQSSHAGASANTQGNGAAPIMNMTGINNDTATIPSQFSIPGTQHSSNSVPTTSASSAPAKLSDSRHVPSTPGTYFSQFFAPSQMDPAQSSSSSLQVPIAHLLPPLASTNLGTPSANLMSSGSNSSSAASGSGSFIAPPPVPSLSGSTPQQQPGGAQIGMDELGQWMQTPSLFDFAGDLGIAEGGDHIRPEAGYLGSLMLG